MPIAQRPYYQRKIILKLTLVPTAEQIAAIYELEPVQRIFPRVGGWKTLRTICKEPLPSLLIREFLKAAMEPESLARCSSLGYKTNISLDEDLRFAIEGKIAIIFLNYSYHRREVELPISYQRDKESYKSENWRR